MINKKNAFKKPLFLFVLIFIFGLIFHSCVNDEEPKEGGEISLGDFLPQFSVEMADGRVIDTQDFTGKIGLIMFFNTTCPDCQKELPVVEQVYEKYKEDRNILIVPIAREENQVEIMEYWSVKGLNLPFSPQENREVYSLFAKSIIPRIYITDKSRKVIFTSGDEDLPSFELLVSVIESNL